MAEITQSDLNCLITQHELWLKKGAKGKTTDFAGLDLSGLELKKANLYHSNFSGCNLSGCNFQYSDLGYSEFRGADLTGANLKAVNLFRASLHRAVLKDVKVNEYTQFYFQLCPEEGSFWGYKKAYAEDKKPVIVKLLIPKSAKRNSATTYRCRADTAMVLEIIDRSGRIAESARSYRDSDFLYEIGKWLKEPEFDEDRWNERTKGIHFYLTKELAWLY